MTSREERDPFENWRKIVLTPKKNDLPDEPKTPHEEVMFCIESTNDIVSKILDMLKPEIIQCTYNDLCKYQKGKEE